MAIVLITGLPGHGKTLYTLSKWRKLAEAEKRPVFHNSIPGLTLDWQPHEPTRWFDLPATSIMVIDECQRVFPVRPRGGEVPEHYRQLETHRHLGLDLVLITQHPTLIDSHVRKLVDRHMHVVRRFGTTSVVIYENPSGVSDYPEKVKRRAGIIVHEWKLDKATYEVYKSAEVHTVKRRLPLKFYVLCAAVLAFPVLGWLAWGRLHARMAGQDAGIVAVQARAASSPGAPSGGGSSGFARPGGSAFQPPMGTTEYLAQFQPRIPGALYTAPIYDAMTKPVEAPYPAVCMVMDGRPCLCFSQRGFRYPLDEASCRRYAVEPFDPYWRVRPSQAMASDRAGGGGGVDPAGAGAVAPVSGSEAPRAPLAVAAGG